MITLFINGKYLLGLKFRITNFCTFQTIELVKLYTAITHAVVARHSKQEARNKGHLSKNASTCNRQQQHPNNDLLQSS